MTSRIIITGAAAILAAYGGALLFLPRTVLAGLSTSQVGSFIPQQLGIACIGLAVINWLVRRSPMGGIYGRPVVAGNLIYFTATFVLYVDRIMTGDVSLWLWMGLLLTGLMAVAFTWLLFKHSPDW